MILAAQRCAIEKPSGYESDAFDAINGEHLVVLVGVNWGRRYFGRSILGGGIFALRFAL